MRSKTTQNILCAALMLVPTMLNATASSSEETFSTKYRHIANAINHFAAREGKPLANKDVTPVEHVRVLAGDSHDQTFIGIHHNDVERVNYGRLKTALLEKKGITTRRTVQIVGDSNEFSPEGTLAARAFIHPYFEGDHMLEYGYTGYMNPKALDINSTLNEWLEDHPDQAFRVVANVVGHSVHALKSWGCRVSDKPQHFVVVYNDFGMDEGRTKDQRFTRFGDDVVPSDNIMSAEDNDTLVVIEGGAQSFRQAVNVMKNGVRVSALYGVRPADREAQFFSAAGYFALVQELLNDSDRDAAVTEADIRALTETYMQTHEAWDANRPDAETKAALFESSMKEFIEGGVYRSLGTLLTVTKAE